MSDNDEWLLMTFNLWIQLIIIDYHSSISVPFDSQMYFDNNKCETKLYFKI